MNFYQLYKDKYNFENAVFISTGGNMLKNQVINVLKAFPNAKLNNHSIEHCDVVLYEMRDRPEVRHKENQSYYNPT